ncbi:primosomal protein DnaI [Thermoactinomyces daqus]|uniref:Primosomal protein DnaI n=1 Tax=Thermoactinomyces daqus TaxID=1329516 RepID=A0A7W1XB33_9BACL|nr:primosomal protein DnaI [Thermoactinomyces daqus]MBA4543423.1 primosomal protein DnaI [Thermoactinomyces daqus]
MNHARTEIRKILAGRQVKSPDERVRELMDHTLIRSFMKEHPEIPLEAYKRSLSKLSQYVREQGNCVRCQGLESCPNIITGHHSVLVGYETNIDLQMKKCHRLEAYEQMKKRQALMKSHMIPKSILAATFDTIDLDPDRTEAISQAIEYCERFESGVFPKHGLYLYGPYGVGKSHIAGAMANYLTGLGVDSFMVYVPDFVQSVYDSIRKQKINELVDSVKQAKVLILDDIGAENLNPWMRDEIIGAILQYRMGEELPTIYTSNLTLNELENHLAFTNKGGEERIKAVRIMERIKHYTKPIRVSGKNRREGAI